MRHTARPHTSDSATVNRESLSAAFITTPLLILLIFSPSPAFAQNPAQTPQEPYEAQMPSDPWESFNQPMFTFNLKLDEYVLRPVATGYAEVVPEPGQRGIDRFFKNLGVLPRFVNSALQGKIDGAGREVGRFAVNTILGGVGFFDVADDLFGWQPSTEDFGQTLGHYGVSSGPYLMLPFYGPSSVRDAFGFVVDSAMNPMTYLLPFPEVFASQGGLTVANAVNFRSLNLDLFEQVELVSVDLYGAVQDGYLQRRANAVEE